MYQSKKLWEITKIQKGTSITKDKIIEGYIPVIAWWQNPAYFCNKYNRSWPIITVSASWAYAGFLNFFNYPIFASDCTTIEPIDNSTLDITYLFLCLKSKQEEIYRLQRWAGQPHVYGSDLQSLEISLPPLSEQQAIATKLDQLQYLIDLKQQAIAKTDELAKSIFLEMFGDPMTNEKRWKMKKLEEVVENNKHSLKTWPFWSSLKKEFYTKTGRKIYGQEQVIKGDINYGNYYISNEKYEELKNYTIKQWDILISLVGSYGNLLIIPEIFEPWIINPRLMKISFDKEKVAPIYFQYFFESGSTKTQLEQLSHWWTMWILNLWLIKSLYIPLPPISLQQQFADIITEIELQKSDHKKALAKLEELYQSEMQRSFSM